MDLDRVASSNGREAATRPRPSRVGAAATWADDRLGLAAMAKKNLRKVFPDHWSFMLGEIALWSFVILLLTGTFLTLWYQPSMSEVTYQGSYDQLRGIHMSAAYASTLDLSFDVRGGLLMRQMHHWAAMVFIAGMLVHLMRVFFTGAFRKPRELNWVIGCMLLLLGTLEGFTGYSLPDDLLSGTGIRAADGFMKSIPVVGAYLSSFLFGGEYPGDVVIGRLYIAHVLLIPGIILALITVHMLLLVYHKHTQWPGPGRTEQNVVGFPMLPVYAAKAGGFFFIVFGMVALMGGLLSLNPVWKYGPYDPSKVTAGSQPDWYMGMPDGALRIFPGWETHIWGTTWSWNIFLPIIVLPAVLFGVLVALPFLEAWVTGDRREHHLLERPRNAPTRTATMVALMTFYGLLWSAGGNDILAPLFHLSINQIIYFLRIAVFLGPILAFWITRRWCISLQRHDNERLLHGYETGVVLRSPDGGYSERHAPLDPHRAYTIGARDRSPVPNGVPDESDSDGVPAPSRLLGRARRRLHDYVAAGNAEPPIRSELEHGREESEHEPGAQPELAHPVDGHQYDSHRAIDGEELRR